LFFPALSRILTNKEWMMILKSVKYGDQSSDIAALAISTAKIAVTLHDHQLEQEASVVLAT
jgi:hypothetical protein